MMQNQLLKHNGNHLQNELNSNNETIEQAKDLNLNLPIVENNNFTAAFKEKLVKVDQN